MAGEDWRRLADYVVARRVELGMRDRRALAEATGVTERTLGKLENGQSVSASTLGMVENRLGWAPGSCRRILAGGEPNVGSPALAHAEYEDPTLWHIASTPGLPPDVVRGLVALARNWRQGDDGTDEQAQRRALPTARPVAPSAGSDRCPRQIAAPPAICTGWRRTSSGACARRPLAPRSRWRWQRRPCSPAAAPPAAPRIRRLAAPRSGRGDALG
jgi:hypothetical protein